ncbi:MAG: DoxX family protein [bacterium]|nr:DoxX family protein [bacterium]
MKNRFFWNRLPWVQQIAVWALDFYVAWNVLPRGYQKLMNLEKTTGFFVGLGLPSWLAAIVGALEIIAPLLMFIPQTAYYAAVTLFVIMVSAAYYSNWGTLPLTLAAISLIVAILTRPGFLRKAAKITKIKA